MIFRNPTHPLPRYGSYRILVSKINTLHRGILSDESRTGLRPSHFGCAHSCAMGHRKPGRPIPIDTKGGRGARYVPGGRTTSGRPRSSPRCPDFVGAAIMKAARAHACAMGQPKCWGKTFLQACASETEFAKLRKAVDSSLTCHYRPIAREVLDFHRHSLVTAEPVAQGKVLASFVRVMTRKETAAGALPSIGIPEARALDPPSFMDWIEPQHPNHCRATPLASSGEGPLAKAAKWGLERSQKEGVIVCSRARDTIATWAKKPEAAGVALPPLEVAEKVIHQGSLPAAIGSKGDHYFLWTADQKRYLGITEVLKSLGVRDGSPLQAAFCQVPGLVPATAVECCGNAIHAGVARLLLWKLWEEGSLLPSAEAPVSYASGCSSVDFFAEAVSDMWPGAWRYRHASESMRMRRKVLEHAWAPDEVFADASDPDGRIAQQQVVDLYVLSPNCQKFSKRNKQRNEGGALEVFTRGAAEVADVVAPVIGNYRARVVIVENVATPEAIDIVGAALRKYDKYRWREQTIDAKTHAGYPAARERHFWIGKCDTCGS